MTPQKLKKKEYLKCKSEMLLYVASALGGSRKEGSRKSANEMLKCCFWIGVFFLNFNQIN